MSAEHSLVKTDSVTSMGSCSSITSDDLEAKLEEVVAKEEFEEAPHDIFTDVDGERVRVLKCGEKVPCLTKYKKLMMFGPGFVKFRYKFKYSKKKNI